MRKSCLCFLWIVLVAGFTGADRACAEPPFSGRWHAGVLPERAEPAWMRVSGQARETIENGRWVVRGPRNFVRRLVVGPFRVTEGQENTVEFNWGTNCSDNRRADGFSIITQGRRLRLHPIHRKNGADLLLVGVPGGMGPDRKASHVDLKRLTRFDATAINRFRIRWVTNADSDYGFDLSINGQRVGALPGEPDVLATRVALGFEFRGGTHTVDGVAWRVNRGGRPVPSRDQRRAVASVPAGFRQLFLDDVMVDHSTGLTRILHQPTKYDRNPVIRHHQRPWQNFRAQLYGTVLYIPEEKIFKMWYLAGSRFPDESAIQLDGRPRIPNFQMLAYAESLDGFHWRLPELGLVTFNGSRHNNLCRFSRENAEGVAVVHDPRDPDPRRRYKAFYWEHSVRSPHKIQPVVEISAMSVSFSADGKDWTNHPGNPVIGHASDTGHQALWDPFLKMFVAYGRFGAGGRRIARAESRDFLTWSHPRLVFAADATDGRGAQFYGMGTTIYEGVYIGLPWMFWEHTTNRLDVQLASSRDGIRWQRAGGRKTFIPNGNRGSWDGGCVFTAAQPLQVKDDTIFIFYSGLSLDHEQPRPSRWTHPEYGESSIGVATLRRDGFVSLRAGAKPGRLRTLAFQWPAGFQLHVNVQAEQGDLVVSVLDQRGTPIQGWTRSRPVSGDRRDAVVSWPEAKGGPPAKEPVSLEITLRKADLFSYWLKRVNSPMNRSENE